MDPISTIAITYVASQLLSEAIKDSIYLKIKYSFFPKKTFQIRLENLIYETILEFEAKYPYDINSSNFPFYHSQILLDYLLKFRLFRKSLNKISKEIFKTNQNIIPPNKQELSEFYSIFVSKVKHDKDLKRLFIEENFQEEIFNISNEMNSLKDSVDIAIEELNGFYNQEYQEWLIKVDNDIKNFKPKSALENLEFLETKISSDIKLNSRIDNRIKSKFKFLKGICKKELWNTHEGNKDIIEAYRMDPINLDLQEKAALSFIEFGEDTEAQKIGDNILKKFPENETGLSLRCLFDKNSLVESINSIPNFISKSKKFKTILGRMLLVKRRFEEIGIVFSNEIETYNIPNRITYENKEYNHFIMMLLLERHYQNNTYINLNSRVLKINSEEIKLLNKIVNLYISTYNDTEKPAQLNYNNYLKCFTEFLMSAESKHVLEMYNAYNNISSNEKEDLALGLTYCLCQIFEFDKVITVINNLKGSILNEFHFIKSFAFAKLKNLNSAREFFYKYVKDIKEVNGSNFLTILGNSEVLFQDKEDLRKFMENIESYNILTESSKKLLQIFLGIKEGKDKSDLIKSLAEFDLNTIELPYKKIIAFFYSILEEYEKSNTLLKGLIDEQNETPELKLYIENLYYSKNNINELLRLLKLWRINGFTIVHNFFIWEIHLLCSIPDWFEMEIVARKAHELFPENSYFLYSLIHSMHKLHNNESLRQILDSKLKGIDFTQEEILRIAWIAARQNNKILAFDLIFPLANDFNNKSAREQFFYIFTILNREEKDVIVYTEVKDDLFVHISADGNEDMIEINEKSKSNDPRVKLLINKKVGDIVNFNVPISNEFIEIRIEKIYDKYQKLYYAILKEVKDNKASGLNIQSMDFPSGDPDSLKSSLIENFGKMSQFQNDLRQENLSKYYKRKASFSEVTRSVFNDNAIECYHYLASNASNGYQIQQINLQPIHNLKEDINFAIDLPTLLLIYELEKEHGVKFFKKFNVSSFLIDHLEEELYQTEIEGEKKLTLSITTTNVIPFSYPDDYKEKRIKYFKDILSWIKENTISRPVSEKLEILEKIRSQKPEWDNFFEALSDTAFLADCPDSILISDDGFYFELFKNNGKVISSEYFFKILFPDKMVDMIRPFLLQRNYIGLELGFNDLIKAFEDSYGLNFSNYDKCLKNLPYNTVVNPASIFDYVKFIKEIYMKPEIPIFAKKEISRNVFAMSLKGLPLNNEIINWIYDLINSEFYLLQNHVDSVKDDLKLSLQIVLKRIK